MQCNNFWLVQDIMVINKTMFNYLLNMSFPFFSQEDEDGDIERIDLDALRTMDKKELNPLKPYNEEPVAKNDKYDQIL